MFYRHILLLNTLVKIIYTNRSPFQCILMTLCMKFYVYNYKWNQFTAWQAVVKYVLFKNAYMYFLYCRRKKLCRGLD